MLPELRPTRCALCGTEGNAQELYKPRLTSESFTAKTFSARRSPDRLHFRVVVCNSCGLLRSDPALPSSELAGLYRQSTMDYGTEIPNIRMTYGRYLERAIPRGRPRGALLEIGCGSGFFLEEAKARGFESVRGVEPSSDAVARANPSVRPSIACDTLRPGLLSGERFDAICMFQVIDHLTDPAEALTVCAELLAPGGRILIITHDAAALSARLLGERSPIVDVEHTYLFDRSTLVKLLEKCGYEVLAKGSVWNRFSLNYLMRLAPSGRDWGRTPGNPVSRWLGAIPVRAPFGNMYMVARAKA